MLPLPYGTGAGYIFSAALLKWVAMSPEIAGWVEEARGADRERLQWQKYEDTTTGYWVSEATKLGGREKGHSLGEGKGHSTLRPRPRLSPTRAPQPTPWPLSLRLS